MLCLTFKETDKLSSKVVVPFYISQCMRILFFLFFLFFSFFFRLFGAAPTAYGGSQARGLIRAAAAGHSHSHSSAESDPHLRPTPQLTARLDP